MPKQGRELDAALPRMRASSRDVARWRRQCKAAGMSMAEAVRAALDAYFASPPSPAGSAWRHPARGQDTGLGGDAGDRVAALRGAVPGLRRGSEIARPSDPQPETPPRPLSPKARQRVRATAQANDAMDTDQLVAVLGPLLPGEDRRAIRALVESLRDGA